MSEIYDVLILGGGPSGLTAAIYTSRANLKSLVIAGNPPGGQLMQTTDVENYPGFPEGVLGPDLIEKFRCQALKFGATAIDENVVEITGCEHKHYCVKTDTGMQYEGKSVIVATGASAKWLNIESEQRLRGYGVSACATCDGFFFKNKAVAVVGGGDAAMEEANFLTKFATKLYILVRGTRDDMRASKIMQQRAFDNPKIEFIFNTEVSEVLGDKAVSGLRLKNNLTQELSTLEVQGLFLAIGHKPNTGFLKDFAPLGKMDYAQVVDNVLTTKPGFFISGDVADYRYRQAVTAAGFGCMAALEAEKYLTKLESNDIAQAHYAAKNKKPN